MTSADRAAAESKTKGRPVLVLVLLLIWAVVGCSAAKKTADAVVETSSDMVDWVLPADRPDLRPTLALVGVECSLPSVQAGFAEHFRQALPGFLKKDCGETVLDAAAAGVKTPPRLPSGLLDGYALAAVGRKRGMNFFLIGTLVDVQVKDEVKGFWLWKDDRYSIQTVVRLELVDCATGAKILDDTSRTETEIDSVKYQEIEQFKTIQSADLTSAIATLLHKGGKLVCTAMHSLPWQGFVVAAEPGRITLSSGSRAGLAVGKTLDVFDIGPVITSKDGQRFLSVGDKLGEATLTAVSEDRAEAAFGDWERLKEGGTVRVKK